MIILMPAAILCTFVLYLFLRPRMPAFLRRGYDGASLVVTGLGTAATMYAGWLPPGATNLTISTLWMFFYLWIAFYGLGIWASPRFDQELLRLFLENELP